MKAILPESQWRRSAAAVAFLIRCRGLSFRPPLASLPCIRPAQPGAAPSVRTGPPPVCTRRAHAAGCAAVLGAGALANDTRLPTEDVRAERAPRAALRASALRRIFAKLLAKLPSFTHQRLSSLTLK